MPGTERSIPTAPPAPASPGADDDAQEWHIAGVLVHALPDHLDAVRDAIAGMTGAEIHAASDTGKLVVTLEAPTSRGIAAHLTYLHQLEGVMTATLVYQHNEDARDMDEEVTNAEEIANESHSPGLY